MFGAIAGIFGLIPGWLYAGAIAVLLTIGGGLKLQLSHAQNNLAAEKTSRAEENAQRAQVAIDALAESRNETIRRQAAFEKLASENKNLKVARDTAAARARQLNERLRLALGPNSAPGRGGSGKDSPLAAGSLAAGASADVLAQLLGESDRRATEFAIHADSARAAGLACQAAYNALAKP